jgi:magnesium-transporting ATPase (P-type)
MIAVVAIKANVLNVELPQIFIKVILWLMFFLFLLNTLGNVFSLNKFEQLVVTAVTLIVSLLSLRLVLEKKIRTN